MKKSPYHKMGPLDRKWHPTGFVVWCCWIDLKLIFCVEKTVTGSLAGFPNIFGVSYAGYIHFSRGKEDEPVLQEHRGKVAHSSLCLCGLGNLVLHDQIYEY